MGYSRNNNAAGGVSDGVKGDIRVTGSGATWTVENAAITNAKINDVDASKVTQSSNYRFITDTQKSTWDSKQSALNNANTTTNGILTSADWNTFNGKQTALGFTPLNPNNNLSDLSNIITSRNNLKIYDLYLTGGNQTTTSTAASSITGLSLNISANKRYYIRGFLSIGCSNTGGIKLQVSTPNLATLKISLFGNQNSTTATFNQYLTASATLGTALNLANFASGFVIIYGEVNNSTNSGTIQFGFASGANSQTSTIFQLGSQITITEL